MFLTPANSRFSLNRSALRIVGAVIISSVLAVTAPLRAQSPAAGETGRLVRITDADAATVREQHRAVGAGLQVAREAMAQVVQPIGRAIMSGDFALAEKLINDANKPGGAAETMAAVQRDLSGATVALAAVAIRADGSTATTVDFVEQRSRQQKLADAFKNVTGDTSGSGTIGAVVARLEAARATSETAWKRFDPSTIGGADGTTLNEREAMDLAMLAVNAQIATENVGNAAFFLSTGAKRWLLKKTTQSAVGDGPNVDPTLLPAFEGSSS